MFKKILLPTNCSEDALKTLEYAITTDSGADILILYVIDTDYLNALEQQDLKEEIENNLINEGKESINNFKQQIEDAKCQGHCNNVNLTTLIKKGDPVGVILKTIDEESVDEIIMSKSSKSGIEKFFSDSIIDKVIKNSNVPVKVIS